jgi:two-component system, OmpR family, phosphate regulon response regulator PhoB
MLPVVNEGRRIAERDEDAMASLVLIIEDEADLVATLEYNLEKEGYRTRSALAGRPGLEMARQEPFPDLILLDLMLPDLPGTDVCRTLRGAAETREIPIVMMTAKAEEIDRVVGFEVGADDYVVKPFSVSELLLRVRAILRRARREDGEAPDEAFGRLRLDREGHRVWVDQEEILLTALEFRLLTTLLARKGRVQTRDGLLTDVWGYDVPLTTRTVDTHIKRLRAKLGAAGEYVETVRGVGYRFRGHADETTA